MSESREDLIKRRLAETRADWETWDSEKRGQFGSLENAMVSAMHPTNLDLAEWLADESGRYGKV